MNRRILLENGRRLLGPLVSLFNRLGFGPLGVTLLGLGFTGVATWFIWRGSYLAGAAALIAGGLLDVIDGELARRNGMASKAGAVLDSSCDRIGEMLILGAFLAGSAGKEHPILVYLVLAALGGSYMVSYVRARAEGLGLSCTVGFVTRFERIVIIVAGLVSAAIWDSRAIIVALLLLAAGTWLTTVRRFARVFRVGGEPLSDGE